MTNPSLIAINWGSSNLRAYLLDEHGQILQQIKLAKGIKRVRPDSFSQLYQQITQKWLQNKTLPAILSGMIGSKNGWCEVPYVKCPTPLTELANHLKHPQDKIKNPPYLVPGISFANTDWVDVMRGEETEIFGAIDAKSEVFCTPGTHSKWVYVQNEVIKHFTTYLSGELYQVLTRHSILKTQRETQIKSDTAFLKGLEQAQNDKGMLANLFNVRAKTLHQQLNFEEMSDYLSGLIVGYELQNSNAYWQNANNITIISEPRIAKRYQLALKQFGKSAKTITSAQAVTHGLWKIAKLANLM